MTTASYLISEVYNPKKFFQSALSLYATKNAILTTWGTIPTTVKELLASYKAPQGRSSKLLFRENSFYLNEESLETLVEQLGQEQFLGNLSWGLRKGRTSLCLCRDWNDISLDSSDIVDERTLLEWLEDQRIHGVIGNIEKLVD